MRFARLSGVVLALSVVAGSGEAQVRIAGDVESSTFRDLRRAVESSVSGDLVLVSSGSYEGFEIDGKSLTIAAEAGATVHITGPIAVRNLAAHQRVFLSGLSVEVGWVQIPPSFGDFFALEALTVENSEGHVQVQDCSLNGGDMTGFQDEEPGGDAAVILASSRVSFIGCTVSGGMGADDPDCGFGKGYGGPSGDAIDMLDSDVAVLDCIVNGGDGGDHCSVGGDGGAGIRASGGTLFAANSTLTGGEGGFASDSVAFHGGSGGDGLSIDAGHVARLMDTVSAGGLPGPPDYPGYAVAGVPIREMGGATAIELDGHHLVMDAPGMADAGDPVDVTFSGDPGTRVRLLYGRRPDFLQLPAAFAGVLLQRGAFPFALAFQPGVVLDGSGMASGSVPAPNVSASLSHGFLLLQPLVLGSSGFEVPAARSVLIVNDDLGPDCNNNGLNDIEEVLGGEPDCDGDLVPDECLLFDDCNSNLVPDVCDVEAGSSADANGNLVPDECEATTPLYVDDDAGPGGDGSLAAPFQSIGEAVSALVTDGTIIVLDGLYVGAANRDLTLDAEGSRVMSQNGPANCIIDCQSMGRAFNVSADGVEIEGFTIRDGLIAGSGFDGSAGAIRVFLSDSTRIAHCVLQNNSAGHGGAVSTNGDDLLVEDCVFRQNSASQFGGAISFVSSQQLHDGILRRCVFDGNTANASGAVAMPRGVVSHCSFLENSALLTGGALSLRRGSIDNCLFAANSSEQAGAVNGQGSNFGGGIGDGIDISHSTFVNNTADIGGALYLDNENRLFNSILWGNSAAQGSQIWLRDDTTELTADFTDSQGGAAAVDLNGGTLTWGAGNLDTDPLFADPLGPDGQASTTFDNDYRLGPLSPCIDAGANHLIAFDLADIDDDLLTGERVSVDLDGNARRVDDPAAPDTGSGMSPITDLGPFER